MNRSYGAAMAIVMFSVLVTTCAAGPAPIGYEKKDTVAETFYASVSAASELKVRPGTWHYLGPLPRDCPAFEEVDDIDFGARHRLASGEEGKWRTLEKGGPTSYRLPEFKLADLPSDERAVLYLRRTLESPAEGTYFADISMDWWVKNERTYLNGELIEHAERDGLPLEEGTNTFVLRCELPTGRDRSTRVVFRPVAPVDPVLEQLQRDFPDESMSPYQTYVRLWKRVKSDPRDDVEKTAFRRDALAYKADRDPLGVLLRRTKALLADLQDRADAPDLSEEAEELNAVEQEAQTTEPGTERRFDLYRETFVLRRRIAFANPLLDFDDIVFATHHRAKYNHMCDQYFGFHARPGGSIYVLHDAFGENPRVENIVPDSTVENGRFEGQRLEDGSFMSLDLSYEAGEIAFAWTEAEPTRYRWSKHSTYHIFKARIDGSGLRQLPEGEWNDFDPCFLPNGRIAFISERRGGYGRCHGRPVPTYTLHSMEPDGSDIRTMSYHETNEWHPSVDAEGMLVYSRWDYVDRDSDIAHHIWLCYPDGRDPRSYHGNYPIRRHARPWMELSIRQVPDSPLYLGVAAPHHGQAYGSLILIDQRIPDDNFMSQLRRVTPEVRFPESEGGKEAYGTPWPLSEDYYLCVYDEDERHYGIYLVDSFGNKVLIYQDPKVACLDPIPFRARLVPPVIPTMVEKADGPSPTGTVAVIDVYDSDFEWPEGADVKALRIVQIFPKSTPSVDRPRIGKGDQSLARGVLGTVPVEPDGSAYFEMPANIAVYFQALDSRGLAIQSMKSDTFVHPGEQLTCQGCHEPKRRTNRSENGGMPLALERPPSRIEPDVDGSNPLLYPRLVQPVLDRKCVGCHRKHDKAPSLSDEIKKDKHGWSHSFVSLAPHAWAKHGGNGALRRKNKTSRSIPGEVGTMASDLFKMLEKGHHEVQLTPEEMHRITLWLDCNSNFYGAYYDTEKQARGEVVMPRLE